MTTHEDREEDMSQAELLEDDKILLQDDFASLESILDKLIEDLHADRPISQKNVQDTLTIVWRTKSNLTSLEESIQALPIEESDQ